MDVDHEEAIPYLEPLVGIPDQLSEKEVKYLDAVLQTLKSQAGKALYEKWRTLNK